MLCEDGKLRNIKLIDKRDIFNNHLQVTNQHVSKDEKGLHRYDVSLLVNGLSLVHVDLKALGVNLKEVFNQIDRYRVIVLLMKMGCLSLCRFLLYPMTRTRYYSNTVHEKGLENNTIVSAKARMNSQINFVCINTILRFYID